jgi:hypothetical protein
MRTLPLHIVKKINNEASQLGSVLFYRTGKEIESFRWAALVPNHMLEQVHWLSGFFFLGFHTKPPKIVSGGVCSRHWVWSRHWCWRSATEEDTLAVPFGYFENIDEYFTRMHNFYSNEDIIYYKMSNNYSELQFRVTKL